MPLHEELAYGQEFKKKTLHPSIYRLQGSDSSLDREILLGVISILADGLRTTGVTQRVRDGIFQIASCDIDGFLHKVTGLDMMLNWRQLTDGSATKVQEKEGLVRPVRKRIAESVLSVSS